MPCRIGSSRLASLVVPLLALWLSAQPAVGGSPEGDLTAGEILQRVNDRPSGTQYRRARLSLINDGEVVRRYVVQTLRSCGALRSVTLFFLARPETLEGTAFLLEETRPARVAAARIWLYLPAGRQEPLEIEAERARQSLLGSDFTYQDWRVWLPAEDLRVDRGPDTAVRGRPVFEVLAEPTTPELKRSLGWGHARLLVDRATGILVAAEYADAAGEPPDRVFEASGLRQVDGEWLPGRMEMRDLEAGRSTVVELLDAWHQRPVAADWFRPRHLPRLATLMDRLPGTGGPYPDPGRSAEDGTGDP